MTATEDATTTAVGVYCNVCWETHDVHSIYVLPCGHGYCANVLRNQTRKPPHPPLILCPHCKQEYKPTTKRRIYLDLRIAEEGTTLTSPPLDRDYRGESLIGGYSERVYQQAENASNGIDMLDGESAMESIRRAASEIRKVTDKMGEAGDTGDKVKALLNSLSAFITRIAPLWNANREVATLRQHLIQKRNKIQELQQGKAHAERVADEAVETAEKAQREHVRLREEKETMQARLDKAEEDARERMTSISRLQDSVTSYKRRDAKYIAKIQELEAQLEGQRKKIISLEEESSAHDTSDGLDDMYFDLDAVDDEPSSDTSFPVASSSTTRKLSFPAPPPQRPKFGTEWNLKPPTTGKRKREPEMSSSFPIARDGKGHASKPVALGSRMKMHRHN
ncbi:hypothetical protein NM688_g2278 [Phlebia brevispora]|uniref:Uncharacterized protein n=1 Tax=Phlebia brevispora TaxID=194682 RepID=A0ACC1T8R0_9APHY|nr:hypothetical protein NM688_g2278 [Phlebia brevispora]